MSIVVGVRKDGETWVGADTQSSFGSNRVPPGNGGVTKLRKVGRAVIGTTGWGIYENILDDFLASSKLGKVETKDQIFTFFLDLWKALHEHYPFVNDQSDRDDSPFGNLDAAFLVASPHGLYYVASDLSVTEFRKYCAVGSGADFGTGAAYILYDTELGAKEIVRRSVETACAFNLYCGGDVELLQVG
jgi:ATP-dependent protease HslVU (ClpYQ) peptidase subunit